MSFTAANVITVVRSFLKDEVEEYRWSNSSFLSDIDSAVQELKSRRADLLLSSSGSQTTVSAISSTASSIPFPDRFLVPIAHFVCRNKYLSEFSDTNNLGMAEYHGRNWDRAIET